MKIHSTAKFDGKTEKYHADFEINLTENQIIENSTKIINLAIGNFKKKCDDYFFIDFATMYFFEVYFYDEKSNEIQIFKKEKS